MTTSQRIFINIGSTYGRSILSAVMALFASRWVLLSLGQSDFGLYSLIGSIVVFITFINTILSGSAARFFAYSLGRGDKDELNRWFNSAASIHLCLGVLLALAGWPVGELLIRNFLVIPVGRIEACLFVFRLSVVSAFFSMISVPFLAMFTAQQRIFELAIFSLFQSTLAFCLALCLRLFNGDRLVLYGSIMALIVILLQLIQMMRAMAVFPECRLNPRMWFEHSKVKSIFSYALWTLIGGFGTVGREQGSALILNFYCGPQVNAAYGIASQVSAQLNQLSVAMINALAPEINACEGRGDRQRMLNLSFKASKYSAVLIMCFAIPFFAEIDYVLRLWLSDPPQYTIDFCRLILATYLLDRLTTNYFLAINANGNISAYQSTVGVSFVLAIPISVLLLMLGAPPPSIGYAYISSTVIASVFRIIWGKRILRISVSGWVKKVFFPCFIVAVISLIAAFLPGLFMEVSFLRLCVSTLASLLALGIALWVFVLDESDRNRVWLSIHRPIPSNRGEKK